MSNELKLYPRVFRSDRTGRVYFPSERELTKPEIKIQPMEKYGIAHTRAYRIDEEGRYPYAPLEKNDTGLYYTDYDFCDEQKYNVKIRDGEELIFQGYIYSVKDDLRRLNVYKGDTHLHTCRSDGKGTPFEVGLDYRRAGFDLIAVTDHHKYFPSLEAIDAFSPLTELFKVYTGEEIHNGPMGYFHIVNFGGKTCTEDKIFSSDPYVIGEVDRIMSERDLSGSPDPRGTAYRIYVADKIRSMGGVAILAHPFWEVLGEYHMQTEELMYLLRNRIFDAMELVASCDGNGNGINLQEAVWQQMLEEGIRVPCVGASDAHTTHPTKPDEHFNIQFTLFFAPDISSAKEAILSGNTVAVVQRSTHDFRVIGSFRLVKYARFLLDEYFPRYLELTQAHAEAMATADGKRTPEIDYAEEQLKLYHFEFFGK